MAKQSVVVVAVAVALAVAFATSGQQGQQTFAVGVTNSTTTPAQGAGHPQAECGMGVWRSVPASANQQRFDCYPSGTSAAFDLTYKDRLADDADGNAVYHRRAPAAGCRLARPRWKTAQGS